MGGPPFRTQGAMVPRPHAPGFPPTLPLPHKGGGGYPASAARIELPWEYRALTDQPTADEAGLKGCCPRCGRGKLFRQWIVVRDKCEACGLDYSFADAGDGPAIFAIFILGFVVLGAALIAEFKFNVSPWFHIIVWGLVTPLLALGLLRVLKSLLITQQYRTKAEQGRFK